MSTQPDTRRKRDDYTDDFVAGAVMIMKGYGYPDVVGALTRTVEQLGVPRATLSNWFNKKGRNKHEVRSFDNIKRELAHTWAESANKLHASAIERMDEMTAHQQLIGAAISTDKLDNLTKGPQVSIRVHVTGTMGDVATPWVSAGEIVDAAVKELPALEAGQNLDKEE